MSFWDKGLTAGAIGLLGPGRDAKDVLEFILFKYELS
jgi:hypothetical protein